MQTKYLPTLLTIAAILLIAGCIQQNNHQIQILDSETKKPVQNASVQFKELIFCFVAPCEPHVLVNSTTDAGGKITFNSDRLPNKFYLEINAEGYKLYSDNVDKNNLSDSIYLEKEGQKENATVTLTYTPIQCNSNPWDIWYANTSPQFRPKCIGGSEGSKCMGTPSESELISLYYKSVYHIEILNYKSLPKYDVVCLACSCPRGDVLYVEVHGYNAEKMRSSGWKDLTETGGIKGQGGSQSVPIRITYNVSGGLIGLQQSLIIDGTGKVKRITTYPSNNSELIQEINISTQEVISIASNAEDSGIFEIKNLEDCAKVNYSRCPTDLQYKTLEVKIGSKSTVLSWYYIQENKTPKALTYLRSKIYEIDDKFQ